MKPVSLSSQKELMLNELIEFMKNYNAKYKKSKCEFEIFENGVSKICMLNFINRGSHLALRTFLYISIDSINKEFKKLAKNTVCPPYIYGGEITEICEHFDIKISREYTEQIITSDTQINDMITEWKNDFIKICIPFFKKYNILSELNKEINDINQLKPPPLALSTSNRILKGSLLLKLSSKPKYYVEQTMALYNEISINSKNKKLIDDFNVIKEYVENSINN